MSTQSSVVYHEIQEVLGCCFFGLPVFRLYCIKTLYQQKFKRSLDYESLGVKDIKELLDEMHDKGMVLFYEKPENKKTYVMSVRQVEYRRKILNRNVQELLAKYDGEIPLSSFEGIYKDTFKVNLDYHLCGWKDIDHLCKVLSLVVDVANSGEDVMKVGKIYNMPTKSSVVYREIQEILGRYSWGIPMSDLSCLERGYLKEFERLPDYNSLGVNSIEELLRKMHDKGMVLFLPERKKTYVMCARTVKTRQKAVKRNVQELLDKHGGEIPLSCFDVLYKDQFKGKLDYHFIGLNGFDELCEALNLVVEAARGEKVIKAGKIV